ncbi:MAG: hypothetical protein A3B81_06855 [Candidatus Muproteobacteria bacterium RIFCSPHIGHO2_02_FULL_65_16]|uniref:N-acetyltransferase domain-containing protein n=1 Tax=Candidatus Muproteobacteria bacterium RIFCSPHIGHO2_02_FULL_65_16 TaxID=1817766 RepID=A0A1F6U6P2_9PROT|nr:MAG: hypothetical protein A3B81_06855 [Candidatus Muproteobacteria bacterium RIFCSPHIGHO2_02_FULL_65_16]
MQRTPRIRRARLADLAALLALEARFPTDRVSRTSFRRLIARGRAEVLVCADAGAIRGNAVVLFRARSRAARLYSLVVHPAHRGRGVAANLLAAAEAAARRRGCESMRLEVRPDNARALGLYERRGYAVLGAVADFYEDRTPALRMHKALGHGRPAAPGR